MGPQMELALQCIADLEGGAETFTWSHTESSDFAAGFINRTTAARLANGGYIFPLVAGMPLYLTDRGRKFLRARGRSVRTGCE